MSLKSSGQAVGKGRWGTVGRARERWKCRHELEPRGDGVEPVLVVVTSALGDVVQVFAFGHEPNTHTCLRSHGS